MVSCKKSEPVSELEEPVTPVELDIAVAEIKHHVDVKREPDPQYSFLGFGYDVTDTYQHAASVRAKVFDARKFVEMNPGRFNDMKNSSGYSFTAAGTTCRELSTLLSSGIYETDGFAAFKSTLSSAFPDQTYASGKYAYVYHSLIVSYGSLRLNGSLGSESSSFSSTLTDSFILDISQLSAAELVQKYGTHVVFEATRGIRLDMVYQTAPAHGDRESILKEGLRYALGKVFGFHSGYLDPTNQKNLAANKSPRIAYELVGGDVTKLKIDTSSSTTKIDLTEWLGSTSREAAVFTGVTPSGLFPLYELINDASKKAEVKAYILKHILENQVEIEE